MYLKETNTVPGRLLSIHQWSSGNSCTWAHGVRLHIAGTIDRRVVIKSSKEHIKTS